MLSVLCWVIFFATCSGIPARCKFRAAERRKLWGFSPLFSFRWRFFLALLVLSRRLFEELAKAGSDASRLPRLSKIADLFAVVMEHITAIEPAIFSPCLMMIGRRFGSVLLRSLIPQFADTGEIILW